MTYGAPAGACDRGRGFLEPTRWVVLAVAVLFAALAWPALSGSVYAGNDLDHFHLPLRWFYARALAEGHAFDWMPSLFSGFYLTGEGQAGTWHPLHRLLYGALPLVAAFNAEVLASYAFLFAGTFVLLRRSRTGERGDEAVEGLPTSASLLGAMLFTFSGSTMLHFVHPNAIAVVAHLPWNLLAIEEALRQGYSRGRRLLALCALAASTASTILCGYPQYVWIVGCAEVAWVVLHLVPLRGAGDVLAAAGLLAAKAFGAAMAAIQILPTWEHLQGAQRSTLAQDLSGVGSLHPLNLVQLVAPYLFRERALGDHPHEYGVYAGAVPLLLILWQFLSRSRVAPTRRDLVLALLGLLAIVLALGRYVGSDRLQALLPVVGTFRFPARFLFLFHFAVAVLAARAFAALTKRTPDGADHPGWILAGFSAVLTVLLAMSFGVAALASPALLAAGPALFVAAAVTFGRALRGWRGAVPALVVLAAFDAGTYGLSARAWPASRPLENILAEIPRPPVAGARIATLQPEALGRYTGNLPVMLGAEMFDGYAGLPQSVHPAPAALEHLRLGAVDFVQRTSERVPLPGLLVREDGWFGVPAPRPRIRLATRAVVAEDAASAMRASAADDSPSLVYTSEPFALGGPPGSVVESHREPGHIRVRVETPSRQMLVIAERFHAGWRATANGRSAVIHDVDAGLLGLEVDAGVSTVELRFAPQGLERGRAITLAACSTWALLLAVALLAVRAGRDSGREP